MTTKLCQYHPAFRKVALQISAHLFVSSRCLALGSGGGGWVEGMWGLIYLFFLIVIGIKAKGDVIILLRRTPSAHLSPSPWTLQICTELRGPSLHLIWVLSFKCFPWPFISPPPPRMAGGDHFLLLWGSPILKCDSSLFLRSLGLMGEQVYAAKPAQLFCDSWEYHI